MPPVAGVTIVIAVALDHLLAEPPNRYHPIAWYGRLADHAAGPWTHPHLAGAITAAVLPLAFATAAAAPVALAHTHSTTTATIVAAVLLSTLVSLRALTDTARTVTTLTETDPAAARAAIPALVGRDPTTLSPAHLRSAAVESLAENLNDGFVAPLLAFALLAHLSLAAGIAAAAWVKAVNTLDSMYGYPTTPHGTAPARLDDLVMWLPARLTALIIATAARDPHALVRARQSARAPASPNAGWPMATLAAVLDTRLEKPGAYTLNPNPNPNHTDTHALPTPTTAARAVTTVTAAAALATLLAVVIAWP